jgi:hypothetical protein
LKAFFGFDFSVTSVCDSKKYSVALEWFNYGDSIQSVEEVTFIDSGSLRM